MLAVLAMMAASALPVPPLPDAGQSVLSPADAAAEGATMVMAFVDPKGNPMDCHIEGKVSTSFSAATCGRVMRAHFEPARGADGKPAYGLARSAAAKPDMTIRVKPIPGLVTALVTVDLAVVIDRGGRISSCGPAGEATSARLAATACGQFRAMWSGTALEDPEGSPRSYVRMLTAAFEPEGAAR